MLIRNRLNPNRVINTALVTDYGKVNKPNGYEKRFSINFGFAAATYEDGIEVSWDFISEDDRDEAWDNIMDFMSVKLF